MNGAESLVAYPGRPGRRHLLRQPRHVGDALPAALGKPEDAQRAVPVRRAWHRRGRRLVPHEGHAGLDAAAPGPGLANGLANIHNAKRASSGMVNIIGEHSAAHLKYDPPLTSDIEGLARPLSHWVRRADSPRHRLGRGDGGGQGQRTPGQIATLILPGDTSWQDAGDAGAAEAECPPSARRRTRARRARRARAALGRADADHPGQQGHARRGAGAAGQVAGGHRRAARARSSSPRASNAARAGCRSSAFPTRCRRPRAFLKGFKHIVTVETASRSPSSATRTSRAC
jgi:hypothetical protein